MAQKDIQSVLQEDRVFPPSAQFREAATLKAGEVQAMYAKAARDYVGSSRVDLQACKLEYSIVSPK